MFTPPFSEDFGRQSKRESGGAFGTQIGVLRSSFLVQIGTQNLATSARDFSFQFERSFSLSLKLELRCSSQAMASPSTQLQRKPFGSARERWYEQSQGFNYNSGETKLQVNFQLGNFNSTSMQQHARRPRTTCAFSKADGSFRCLHLRCYVYLKCNLSF